MKPMFDDQELTRRIPVWTALSGLFLDTELDDANYQYIASVLKASGYSVPEIEAILENEVAPAFASNLRVVAGAWAGWSEDEVRDRVLSYLARRPSMLERVVPNAWLKSYRLGAIRDSVQHLRRLLLEEL